MLPHMPPIQGSTEERKLCKIYKQLNDADRHALLSFADFLNQQEASTGNETPKSRSSEPLDIPRPKKESVIKAIRRLTSTYPMIDKEGIFEKISALMTEHIMTGRAADDVIDELEEIFLQQYKALTNG